MITIGWGYVSTNIVLGRVNGGQFSVGAGGMIMVGFYQGRAWGLGAVYGTSLVMLSLPAVQSERDLTWPAPTFPLGPGQSYVAASGLYYKVLSAFASFALSTIFTGVGGSLWIGSGSFKYIQVARTSNSLTAATVSERVNDAKCVYVPDKGGLKAPHGFTPHTLTARCRLYHLQRRWVDYWESFHLTNLGTAWNTPSSTLTAYPHTHLFVSRRRAEFDILRTVQYESCALDGWRGVGLVFGG